jgi:5'-phosphate synthase pdxT subunit
VLSVGVLALQGDFAAHERAIGQLGHAARNVRAVSDLGSIDALVLPGGESTTMLKLLRREALFDPLAAFCRSGAPVLGTCAGAILLAHSVRQPTQESLDVIDMDIERNAYGRQVDSFIARPDEVLVDGLEGLEAVFIRAPVIRRTGPEVEVLVRHGGDPVLVRQGPVHAATFHPEMSGDARVLALVLSAA